MLNSINACSRTNPGQIYFEVHNILAQEAAVYLRADPLIEFIKM